MNTHKIFHSHLGETTSQAAERFARFCTAAAELAGFDWDFEIDYRTFGWTGDDAGKQISNICWECGWYGKGPLRKSALIEAAARIRFFVDDE